MFSFDEDLFNSAANDIELSKMDLEKLNTIIDSINKNISSTEFKDEFDIIVNNIHTVQESITELYDRIKRTMALVELSKEYSVIFQLVTLGSMQSDYWIELLEMLIKEDNSVFSLALGQYGASQKNPFMLYHKYILNPDELSNVEKKKVEIIIDLFKERGIIDQNQIDYLLMYVAQTGCGFVVVANTICDAYRNDPKIFESKYGYPLYYIQDGRRCYNSESLLVDVFLSYNYNKLDNIFKKYNDVSKFLLTLGLPNTDTSIWFDEISNIINATDPAITGVEVKRDISIQTYNDYMQNGGYDYACIAVRRFTLEPLANNDSTERLYCDGGHWMNITGVTSDNHFIVSSWGGEWKLISGTPYGREREWIIIQPEDENDGGLVFFKVGDINDE